MSASIISALLTARHHTVSPHGARSTGGMQHVALLHGNPDGHAAEHACCIAIPPAMQQTRVDFSSDFRTRLRTQTSMWRSHLKMDRPSQRRSRNLGLRWPRSNARTWSEARISFNSRTVRSTSMSSLRRMESSVLRTPGRAVLKSMDSLFARSTTLSQAKRLQTGFEIESPCLACEPFVNGCGTGPGDPYRRRTLTAVIQKISERESR